MIEVIEKLRGAQRESGCQTSTPEPDPSWTRPDDCGLCYGAGYVPSPGELWWWFAVCPECVTRCGRCGGDGQVWWEDDRGYEFCGDCPQCRPLVKVVSHLKAARIPSMYTMDPILPRSEEQSIVLGWCAKWVNSYHQKGKGFTLCGPKGVGKTQIAVTVLRKLIERLAGKSFLFLQARELLSEAQYAISARDEMLSMVRRACMVDVLVLDEMKVCRTEWQSEVIEEILTRRYQANQTTIGTTNLEEHELHTMMAEAGERVASRMAAWMPPIEMGGPDLRREKSNGK